MGGLPTPLWPFNTALFWLVDHYPRASFSKSDKSPWLPAPEQCMMGESSCHPGLVIRSRQTPWTEANSEMQTTFFFSRNKSILAPQPREASHITSINKIMPMMPNHCTHFCGKCSCFLGRKIFKSDTIQLSNGYDWARWLEAKRGEWR